MTDETPRTRRPTSTYVLQVPAGQLTSEPPVLAWIDVVTVEVKSTTRRMTALRLALKEWGGLIPDEGIEVRLIAAEDAKGIPVRPKPPEAPQLEIG